MKEEKATMTSSFADSDSNVDVDAILMTSRSNHR